MSQENVEIVRAVIDPLNRKDQETALEHLDTDFESGLVAGSRP